MRAYVAVVVLSSLVVAGCKSRESQVVGNWSGGGLGFEFQADKKFTATAPGNAKLAGEWSFADDTVKATTKTVNGQSPDEFVKKLKEQLKGNPIMAQMGDQINSMADNISKPVQMTLSEDAKTLTLKNPAGGNDVKLTKTES
jgi:hypothetical protein